MQRDNAGSSSGINVVHLSKRCNNSNTTATHGSSSRMPSPYDADVSEVFALAYSPDGQHLAAGCGDGVVRVYRPSLTAHRDKMSFVLSPIPTFDAVTVTRQTDSSSTSTSGAAGLNATNPTMPYEHELHKRNGGGGIGSATMTVTTLDSAALPITAIRFRPLSAPFGGATAATAYGTAMNTTSTEQGTGTSTATEQQRRKEEEVAAGQPSSMVALVSGADGMLVHWHVATQVRLCAIKEPDNQIYGIDYRADGAQFASAGRDARIRIYDEATKTLTLALSAGKTKHSRAHSNRVYAVKYAPDNDNLLVTGGWDNTVQIWDVRQAMPVRSIYGPHICGDGLDISSGDGSTRRLLTASWRPDDALQLWDMGTGKLIDAIDWHAPCVDIVTPAQAMGKEDERSARVGMIGNEGTAVLDHYEDGGDLIRFEKQTRRSQEKSGNRGSEMLYTARFSPDESIIAAGGAGTNDVRFFDATSLCSLGRGHFGGNGVFALSWSPSGESCAYGGGADRIVCVDRHCLVAAGVASRALLEE